MNSLIERARDPRNQFLFDPPVAHIATALLKELAAALEAAEREQEAKVRKLVKRLEDYYNDWSPRMRTEDPKYGASDWQWLAQHLVAIAVASIEPEMSDDLKAKRDAAIHAPPRDEPPAKEGL